MNNLPTQYLDLPTLRVAYCETGSGNNLMLLHGNSESKSIFKQYQTECFADFHTYALIAAGTVKAGQSILNILSRSSVRM